MMRASQSTSGVLTVQPPATSLDVSANEVNVHGSHARPPVATGASGRRHRGDDYNPVPTTTSLVKAATDKSHHTESFGINEGSGLVALEISEPVGDSNSLPIQRKSSMKAVNVKTWEIVALTCFNFPYGLICGTMGLFILPVEAIRLYPNTSSVTLGLSLLVIGVSQLICPLAGRVSDAWPSLTLVGKRKPFMIWGSAVGSTSVIGLWFFSLARWGIMYYFSLFVGMLALNVVYSVQCGLVPDFVDEDQQGKSSGIVAVHGVLGSGLGFAVMIATTTWDFHLVYPLYATMTMVTVGFSIAVASRLQQRLGTPLRANSVGAHSVRSIPHGSSSEQVRGGGVSGVGAKDSAASGGAVYQCSGVSDFSEEDENEQINRPRSRGKRSSSSSRSANSFGVATAASGLPAPPLEHTTSAVSTGVSLEDVERRGSIGQISFHASGGSMVSANGNEASGGRGTEDNPAAHVHNKTNWCGGRDVTSWRFMNLTCRDVAESYTIDTSESLDFFWVFVGRTFYYVGVSVTAFIMFFLRDVVGTLDQGARRLQIGCIALLAQGTAASIAYPMGKLSDNPRVGKKVLIYAACSCMSLVYIGFLLSPIFGSWAFSFVLAVSTLYGAANGCFLAVDYGLALATLPDKNKAAQALGIWGVSAFIGSALGPLLWGALIQFFGGDGLSIGGLLSGPSMESGAHGPPPPTGPDGEAGERRFSYTGYEAMLLGGIMATICAAVMIHFVQLKEREDEDDEFGIDNNTTHHEVAQG